MYFRIYKVHRLLKKLPSCELIIKKIIQTEDTKQGIRGVFDSASLKQIVNLCL